jgi:hypothetical protein
VAAVSSEEVTPVDRPARNPANTPIVQALFYAGGEFRRVGDILIDVAKALQKADQQIDEVQRERLARALEETQLAAQFAKEDVRAAK